jgi:hypothetical protein
MEGEFDLSNRDDERLSRVQDAEFQKKLDCLKATSDPAKEAEVETMIRRQATATKRAAEALRPGTGQQSARRATKQAKQKNEGTVPKPTERELLASMVQAETAAEVFTAVSRWCWARTHIDDVCPETRVASMEGISEELETIRKKSPEALEFSFPGFLSGRWGMLDDELVATFERRAGRKKSRIVELVESVHRWWVRLPEPRSLHPLALVVDAWQQFAPVPGQWDERHHSILPGTLTNRSGGTRQLVTVTGDIRQLSLGFHDVRYTEPDQLPLPGIEPVQPSPVPVLPFVAPFDRAGGTSMTQGRGAAHSLRLFVETLLAIPPDLRRSTGTPTALTCTLRQLRDALWPRGWQRGRDWPRLMAGLNDLSRLGVEWELPNGQGGVWYTVTVRSRPRDGALLDDVFRFEVLLPPGSHHGPMIDRTHLRLLGLDSAPAFRLYLALCWLWDTHGTYRGRLIGPTVRKVERDDAGLIRDVRGHRVSEHNGTPSRRATHKRAVPTGGRIINPTALEQYPALSPDDLAVMAYSPANLASGGVRRRDQRRVARKALDFVAKVTGATLLPVTRPDSVPDCVRVLPPVTHKAAHDAAFKTRRSVDST